MQLRSIIHGIQRVFCRYIRRRRVSFHDLLRMNRAAERLNREAADVLDYQSGEI
jgi:hypothetical protein